MDHLTIAKSLLDLNHTSPQVAQAAALIAIAERLDRIADALESLAADLVADPDERIPFHAVEGEPLDNHPADVAYRIETAGRASE